MKNSESIIKMPMLFKILCIHLRFCVRGATPLTAFPLHLSSWNFPHRLPMSLGCALYIFGSKCQRSRSQCTYYRKWFMLHNWFPFTPIIMKLHTQTLHESRMCPIDFGVKRSKVKVTMHWLLQIVIGALLLSLYTYHLETSHTDSPWV